MDQSCNPTAPRAPVPSPLRGTAALAALAEAVYIVDAAGCITWANAAFARLTGYAPAEVKGQPSTRYYVPEAETLFVTRRRLVRQGAPVAPTLNAVLVHKDGALVPVELTVSSLLAAGRLAGRLAVLRGRSAPTAPSVCLGPAAGRHEEQQTALVQQLRDREVHLTLALEASDAVAFEWDIVHDHVRRVYSAVAVYPETGDSPDTFEGVAQVVHPEDRERFRATVRAALAAPDGVYHSEHRLVWPDGTVRWLAESGRVEFDAARRPVRLIGIAHDVTARAQVEEALQMRTRQLDLLARTAHRLLLGRESEQALLETVFGELAQVLDMEMYYHYRPAEEPRLLRLEISGGITEAERQQFATMRFGELLCGRVAARRERLIVEDLQYCSQPGSEVLAAAGATSYAGFPLLAQGELVGTIAFVSRRHTTLGEGDVQMIQTICDQLATTLERARLLRDLGASEARYRALTQAVPSMPFEGDAAGGNTFASAAWCRYTGLTPEATAGLGWTRAVHPEDLPASQARWAAAMAAGIPCEMRHRLRAADGTYRWFLVRALPLRDGQGTVTRWVGSCTDVEDLVQAEAALRELNATLEQRVTERTTALAQAMAEQQRLEREAQRAEHFALLGRLAAGVSHELRNPLGAVFLHVDLLAEELAQPSPDSAAEVAESLAAIRSDLARVEDLVEDYLSLARVGTLQREVQDLGAAVQAWSAEFQALALSHRVRLEVDGAASLGAVAFHANTLRRVLLNLVQNALEAMPRGGTLTLAGQVTADQVRLEVRDTGDGIAAEYLPQIFEPLHTTKPDGTGLGLYIVQEIVAAHGGQVTVESVVGQGTTFTLNLPRAAG